MPFNFQKNFFGRALIALSFISITSYCIKKIIKSRTKEKMFKRFESPVPYFMTMVMQNYVTFDPGNKEHENNLKEWINAFAQLQLGKRSRAVVHRLNKEKSEDFFKSVSKTWGERANTQDLNSNVGFAFVNLIPGPNNNQPVKQTLHAVAADKAPVKVVGDQKAKRKNITLLKSYIAVSKNPKYTGDKRNNISFNHCTENRILNYIHNTQGEQLKGDLILFTERIPCHSCMRIIEEFKTNNPDLDMTVTFMYGTELHGKLTDDDRGKVKQLNEIGIFVNLVCQVSKRKQVKPKAEGSQESLD